ncbi:hypothetical protein JCM10003_964 [Bacteroides pyogenes JCM 10003]|nr:hypothetical protein JCM10003_964 [Bacteroides pyogenes JCM 10003]
MILDEDLFSFQYLLLKIIYSVTILVRNSVMVIFQCAKIMHFNEIAKKKNQKEKFATQRWQ